MLVLAGGSVLRRALLGANDAEARIKIEAEVRSAFASMTADLRTIASRAIDPEDLRLAAEGDAVAADLAAGRLFESTQLAVTSRGARDVALSAYAPDGRRPLAWAGQPTELELSRDRLQSLTRDRRRGKETWFLAQDELGLRLVHVAVVEEGGEVRGVTAAERPLATVTRQGSGSRDHPCADPNAFCFPTRLGPVAIERPFENPRTRGSSDSFAVQTPLGEPLLTAVVRPEDLALTRERWRQATQSITLMVLAATVLLMAGPLLDWRNRSNLRGTGSGPPGGVWPYLSATLLTGVAILVGRALLSAASPADWTNTRLFSGATYASSLLPHPLARLLISPFDFVLTWLAVAAIVALALVAVESWRVRLAHLRVTVRTGRPLAGYLLTQIVAGTLMAAALIAHEALQRDTIAQTTLDLVHFSLQPWDGSRTALLVGLVLAHATVVGAGVLFLLASRAKWRVPRRNWPIWIATIACWCVPLLTWQALRGDSVEQQLPLFAAAAVVIAAAKLAPRLKTRYRHGSQAFRLSLLTTGLILPAFAFYPVLFHLAGRATAQTVQTSYAKEVLNQWETLRQQLEQSKDEIDAIQNLVAYTERLPAGSKEASTDGAFRVWQRTALARYPITSSIELYDPDGELVSRFAFNLPEDLTGPPRSEEDKCGWEVYGEVAPFFAEERPVLHMGRVICAAGIRRGSIVVHAMLDYENLPFISSRTPYRELLRPAEALRGDEGSRSSELSVYGRRGLDVEFAFYGWSFRPLYPSSEPAWELDADVIRRVSEPSRQPFWAVLRRGEESFNVYLQNDRSGIYALGFPVVTPLGHLVNLAELTVLATGTYLLLLLANAVFGFLSRRVVRAPALLREVRASFYRKLFLAFVAAVIFPVGALAIVTRNYVVDEMRSSVEREALRTASAAGRVVEDLLTQPQLDITLDDNLMVWVSRLIDQDANVFEGPNLVATSERNLFATGQLTTRTPANVYRAVQLDNVALAVAHERVGTAAEYLVAATPLESIGATWSDPHGPTAVAAAGNRNANCHAEPTHAARCAAVHSRRRRAGLLDGRAHLRSGQPAHPRHSAHLPRRSRRADHREVLRRATAARRGFQPDGWRASASAQGARANASRRSVGRNGPAGGARNQKPADADSADRRASAPRAC